MQIQKRKTRFLASVLVLGTVAGAVAGSALLSPAPQASAEGGTGSSAETEVQLNLLPVLSVAAEDFSINITPTDSGSYETATSDVLVDSNAASGYKVYISTKTSETGLVHGNPSITKSITAVTGEVTVSTYESDATKNNTWGYVHDNKISGIPYDSSLANACAVAPGEDEMSVAECYAAQRSAVSASSVKICEADESNMFDPDERPSCPLTIGVKADKSIPSGTYSNTIVITAVPNA